MIYDLTGSEKIPLVEQYIVNGFIHRKINFNIKKEEDGSSIYQQILLLPSDFNYDGLVNALVSAKYPQDKMQAIINNYLLEPQDEKINKEFLEMQAWRKSAKQIAKDCIKYEKENY